MTAWIPDVVPDQLIESAWGNLIRDRTVTPFANAAARDAAILSPKAGMVCWLSDHQCVSRYTGTAWILEGKGRIGSQIVGASDNAPGANVARMSVAFTLPTARLCRVEATIQWSVVTAAITGTSSCSVGFDGSSNIRLAAKVNGPVGDSITGSGYDVASLAAGPHTADFKVINAGTGGTMRITAGAGRMDVWDFGG